MIRILLAATLAAGAILKEADGEHRMYRPPPGALSSPNAPFIIKVDAKNVGSTDFFLITQAIAPGQAIPAHRHRNADEIISIHAGQALASFDGRETTVATGATIFMPRNAIVPLRNTGSGPLPIVAVFSRAACEGLHARDLGARGAGGAAPHRRGTLGAPSAPPRARHPRAAPISLMTGRGTPAFIPCSHGHSDADACPAVVACLIS